MSEKCTQNEREAAPPPKWGSFLKTPGRCLLCSRLGSHSGYLLFVYLCGPN